MLFKCASSFSAKERKSRQKNNALRRQTKDVKRLNKSLHKDIYIIALIQPFVKKEAGTYESKTPYFCGGSMRTGGLHNAGSREGRKEI